MELATSFGPHQSSSLTLAAISHVFTLKYVAEKLGEEEGWLWDLQVYLEPEDGRLWVYGVGEDGVHRLRHRVPRTNHCRRKSCRQGTAQDQFNQIGSLRF